MSDFLDYQDEIYEELVAEFGHEIESNCYHVTKDDLFDQDDLLIP